MRLFSIYDRKAQRYSKPTLYVNEQVAIRDFNFALSQGVNCSIIEDCELYSLGEFDEERGIITAYEKPLFHHAFVKVGE